MSYPIERCAGSAKNAIRLRHLKLRLSVFLSIQAVCVLACLRAKSAGVDHPRRDRQGEAFAEGIQRSHRGRMILEVSNDAGPSSMDTNCTDPAILDFPADLFTDSERRHGAVILHAFLAFYLFILLAIVCDNYFVPAIEKIANRLQLSKDVAGATLMAAASSSPELFINTVGTFVTEGDLGIGTIVGSGVFNILAVPACCGLFAGKCLPMDWWPLTRDSIAYGIAVILLIFILADEKVSWQEAAILIACYIMYSLIMYFNESVRKCIKKCSNRLWATNAEEAELLVEDQSKHSDGHTVAGISLESDAIDQFHEDEDEEMNLWHWPSRKGLIAQGWWILAWPISLLLYLTIPDCRQPSKHRLYPITFAMCILYIASSAYLVAWMITAIGDTARIPDSVMGLTLLAAGTSLPEAVSSVIVTNQGYGAMGLSNSLGSNTFDILVCLGLPWLLKSLVIPTKPGSHYVLINSKGIQYSAISLLSALLILYILFACNKFKIDRKIGFLCLLTYISFVIVATLNELNFFQVVNLPTCGW